MSSGTWNGSSIGDSYIDDTITLTNITQITNRAITDTTGTLTVARGGTGQTSFGQGWLNSDGTALTSSTSPTVNYITATSTTATSTFAGGISVAGSSGLTVLQNGNVGIGTAAPRALLEVGNVLTNLPTANWKAIIQQDSNAQYAGGLLVANTRADAGAFIVNFGKVSAGNFTPGL